MERSAAPGVTDDRTKGFRPGSIIIDTTGDDVYVCVDASPGAASWLDVSTGGGGYTDEQAQDAVGTILTDSASVDFTYNDGANTITAVVLPAGVDHGGLGGLADDDHSQYALLAGRAAGQTLNGGTAAGDDLTLSSTANATKGNIHLGTASTYDQVNDRVGVGILSPANKVHTRGGTDTDGVTMEVAVASTGSPNLMFQKARGTPGAEATIQSGDHMGWALWKGYQSGYSIGTYLRGTTTEAWGAGAHGAQMVFGVVPNASTTLTDALRLHQNQCVSIKGNGALSTPTVNLELNGTDAVLIPKGTTAQEPAAVDGYMRYDTTTSKLRAVQAGAWVDVIGGGGYTDEQAQDAVGTILTDSASIDFTYNDGANTITAAVLPAGVDHGGLGGLADDDHTQYALLAGRAGGQTLNGGTAAADNLTLLSSSHGTPTGDIIAGNYTGTFKIRGKNDAVLQVTANGTNTTGIEVGSDISGNATSYIDLHATSGSDFEFRAIRNSGANGVTALKHTGTGNFDISADNAANIRLTSNGSRIVEVGTTGLVGINEAPARELNITTQGTSGQAVAQITSYAGASLLLGQRANGTRGAETATASGDNLLNLEARGFANSSFTTSRARIGFEASEAWTSSNQGCHLTFEVTPTGSTTINEKMRLSNAANLSVGGNGTFAQATVNAEFQGTDAVLISKGTTAQRPSGVAGYIRHNTDIGAPEFFERAWTQFVGVLDRQVTQLDINTNSSLTTFYTFSVPANVLDTQKMLRLRLFGDYLSNGGGVASTLRVQVVFGGTTMYDETSTAMTVNASRKPFDFEFLLANQNATNVQVLGGTIGLGISGGATTGLGGMNTVITNATGFSTPVFGTAAVDTTANQTLTVSIQHSVNNASTSIRRQFAILEVL